MSNKRDKEEFVITRKDLRQLLFWASIGVSGSKGGSYAGTIVMTIATWADALRLSIPYHIPYPEWKTE